MAVTASSTLGSVPLSHSDSTVVVASSSIHEMDLIEKAGSDDLLDKILLSTNLDEITLTGVRVEKREHGFLLSGNVSNTHGTAPYRFGRAYLEFDERDPDPKVSFCDLFV